MEHQWFFAQLAFFSLGGLALSGVACHVLTNLIDRRKYAFSDNFWKEFVIGTWVLITAFNIGLDVWIIISLIRLIGAHEL